MVIPLMVWLKFIIVLWLTLIVSKNQYICYIKINIKFVASYFNVKQTQK